MTADVEGLQARGWGCGMMLKGKPMPAPGRDYYYGIDLIRFAAALMVSFFHIGFSCWASPTSGGAAMLRDAYALPELADVTWFGWVGVEIFFVISGFVIASSAEGATPLSFIRSRVLRLYPAVWICATATALLLLAVGLLSSPKRYLASMLLVPTGPWIDGQYWTLGVEIVFYGSVFLLNET
jgi:peptidoglycan/LPS O-acetylase OafA/YrhL